MAWEVDWSHRENNGCVVWARNCKSHIKKAREWHFVTTGYLRAAGVNTPVYRKDSWEVDWQKRKEKLVWARNVFSKMPSARNWHWVDFHTLERAGLQWMPKNERKGIYLAGDGYIRLTPSGMTDEDVALADAHGLWCGKRRSSCLEHRLIATKLHGPIPKNWVVRHLNGCKTDNRPDNLVIGTTKENCMDHETARKEAMYWKQRCLRAEAKLT